MSGHLYEAQELINNYPSITNKFTVFEVEQIWKEYSETYEAGWLEPYESSVYSVFGSFRK